MNLSVESVQRILRETAKAAGAMTNTDWTTSVLRALAGLAPGMCIDPPVFAPTPRAGRRPDEHLWDLTISSWPCYADVSFTYPEYIEAARSPRLPKLLLVAESESGVQNSRRDNGLAVFVDFMKLLDARAPLKVMIFGYHPEDGARSGYPTSCFAELAGHMEHLIHDSEDPADYVLFGSCWTRHEYRDVSIRSGVRSEEQLGP